ncbi:MAG TPA: hypothetical protein PKZ01_10685, partial [Candidatus Hydrogenedentes bacterium]|nr:hypothetical protein [Candidatus Hydrogenedentota bacterium]
MSRRVVVLCVIACSLPCLFRHAEAVEASIGDHNGRAVFFIDGRPVAPFLYAGPGGMRETWKEPARGVYERYASLGFRLFQFDTALVDAWNPDGSVNVDFVVRQIRGLREACPDAIVFLRVIVDAPEWYVNRNRQEWIGYANGPVKDGEPGHEKGGHRQISLASEKWLVDTSIVLRDWLTQLARLPEGEAVAGIHIAGGSWHEWFWFDFRKEPDMGPAMTRHFQAWLRAKYGDEATLQKAWNDPHATFDTATVPGLAERFSGKEGVFRDPALEGRMIDYGMCHQEVIAEVPLRFCRTVKEAWPRPIVTGVFHGYLTHLHEMISGGHLAFRRLLESPYVDYMSGPPSYEVDARRVGGTGILRSFTKSFQVHKKLWISEMDQVPFYPGVNRPRVEPFHPATEDDSIATIRRNVAQSLAHGQGQWLYDFGVQDGYPGGFWGLPSYAEEMRRLRTLSDALIEKPYASPADVLFVYDPNCFYYLAYPFFNGIPEGKTDTVSFEAINRTLADAYHSGVVFDIALLEDLPLMNLKPYKVVVFAFAPYMTAEQRIFIREKVARDGRTLVWVYAPGYADGKTLDIARMSELTGIDLARCPISLPPECIVPQGKLGRRSPELRYTPFVLHADTKPLFRVEDPDAEAIGFYRGSSYVALAHKKLTNSASWFSATPL